MSHWGAIPSINEYFTSDVELSPHVLDRCFCKNMKTWLRNEEQEGHDYLAWKAKGPYVIQTINNQRRNHDDVEDVSFYKYLHFQCFLLLWTSIFPWNRSRDVCDAVPVAVLNTALLCIKFHSQNGTILIKYKYKDWILLVCFSRRYERQRIHV